MKEKNRIGLCALGVLAGMLAVSVAKADAPSEERLQLCGSCHNPDGNSVIPENPKLAGLNAKYLQRQLEDMKSGKRKNPTMEPILATVEESEFKALAQYFSNQKRVTAEPDPAKAELIAKGKTIYYEGVSESGVPACAGCHGENGMGSDKFPYIGSQHSAYIVKQLTAFRAGERTNDPKGQMRQVAKKLKDDEIAAVAEFVQTLKAE